MQLLLSSPGHASRFTQLLMLVGLAAGCAEGDAVSTPSTTGGSSSRGGSTSSGGGGAGAATIGGMGTGAGGAGQGGTKTGGGGSGELCGNGAIDVGEDCDAMLLGPATCEDLRGVGSTGVVACTPGCTYDQAGCSPPPTCPDGNVDVGEDCDGANLDGETCASVLLDPQAIGALACDPSCTFDTAACISCGDGNVGGTEQCDGLNLDGASCITLLGAGATGALTCSGSCTYDSSSCARCGDGILQVGEECDDGNAGDGDGCDACQVVCVGAEVQFGLNCYLDLPFADSDWVAADANCNSAPGGHLVSITSAAENDFVWTAGMTGDDTGPRWTALHDRNIEGSFVWTTAEPVSYTNWASGEPNNLNNEDCMEFAYIPNEWNDQDCATVNAYICEFEPPVQFP